MFVRVIIRKGEYRDSVVLMNISRQLQKESDIQEALVVMGTDSNKEVLAELGMLNDEARSATADDMVIALKVERREYLQPVIQNLDQYFVQKQMSNGEKRFTSLNSALEALPGANLAIISVPGEYAAREARHALLHGLHVLVFSDNVSLEDEITLKQKARELGLLVMGPDCGVCNLEGVALALASIVPKGSIGLLGASGSGLQEVAALIDRAGLGISQAIGTGGRDLSDAVGAATMLQGIAALSEDKDTQVIVLVGKTPGENSTMHLKEAIRTCPKPVVTCFLGADPRSWTEAGAYYAPTMDAAAQFAIALSKGENPKYQPFTLLDADVLNLAARGREKLNKVRRYLRGLYGGGTFVGQAQAILAGKLAPIYSNAPFAGGQRLSDAGSSKAHCLLDLGDETFTHGRAHPVIDPLPYRLRISKEIKDLETAIILLDTILGPATYPDPATYLVEAIQESSIGMDHTPIVIASVCGTQHDPQNVFQQEKTLRESGVFVMPSSAQAALLSAMILGEDKPENILLSIKDWARHSVGLPKRRSEIRDALPPHTHFPIRDLNVINVGVELMADVLRKQDIPVIQLTWSPPAGGDLQVINILDKIETAPDLWKKIQSANHTVYDIFVEGQPVWIDVKPAGEVVPGYRRNLITHAGPAIDLDQMEPKFRDGILGAAIIENLAQDFDEATAKIHKGEIELAPAWDYNIPIAGMAAVSYSMPVMVAEDIQHGTQGFSPIMEGPSYEALRSGVYNEAVANRWRWFQEILGPALSAALQRAGGINLRNIISRSLMMGDELHSREAAATLIVISELSPHLALLGMEAEELSRCLEFLRSADRFSQNVLIAGAASVLKAASGIPYSTVLVGMGGNGVEMGIKISSLGNRMFTASAPIIYGRYLNPNTKPEDTVPFAGDSCAVTVYGLGGCAAAASPSVTVMGGGTVEDAFNRTREMWEITVGKNPNYTIPNLNFEGTPTSIDILRILKTGILPVSHAGIVHKKGGLAGAGNARIPMECFKKAFLAFAKELELR